jgi:hypothetical protein
VKTGLMVLVGFVSLIISFVATGYAIRPFVYHVRPGFNEGTPVTAIVFLVAFPTFFAICFLIGYLLVNRYCRSVDER